MGFYENIVHKFEELPIAMLDGVVVSDRVMECGRELVNCLSEWPLTYKMSRQLGFTPGTFRNAQSSLGPQLFFHMFSPQPGGHGKNVMSISRSGGIRPSRSAFILWANPRAGGSCTMMNRQRCARSSSDRLESAKKVRVACWWSNVRVLIQQSNSPNIFVYFSHLSAVLDLFILGGQMMVII